MVSIEAYGAHGGHRPPRSRHGRGLRSSTTTSAPTWSCTGATAARATRTIFESAPVIVQETYDQPRLIPNAMEPRGCLAYGVRAMDEWTLGERHPDPAHREGDAGGRGGHRGAEVPRDRPRRGRRVRLQAQRLRRGSARAGAGEADGPAREVDRGAPGELRRHDPRPRRDHDCTLAGTEDGKILGVKFVELADMGAYFQLLTPGIPELGAWVYMGPTARGVLVRVPRRPHELHAHRRLPRRRPARGHLRARAARRRVRPEGGQGPGGGPAHELRTRRSPRRTTSICGLQRRLRRTTSRCSTRRSSWSATTSSARSSRRAASAATRSSSGSGSRTYIEMCGLAPSNILGALRYAAGGWDGATIECLPDRQGHREDRHVAARPGPRDQLVADRGRRAGRRRPTTSRSCTATPRSRRSAWTRTARGRSRSAVWRCTSRWRRSRRRPARSPRTSSR